MVCPPRLTKRITVPNNRPDWKKAAVDPIAQRGTTYIQQIISVTLPARSAPNSEVNREYEDMLLPPT
jgi:hypothetical protein